MRDEGSGPKAAHFVRCSVQVSRRLVMLKSLIGLDSPASLSASLSFCLLSRHLAQEIATNGDGGRGEVTV